MTEVNLILSTSQKNSGDNTKYSFDQILLPSEFKIGDDIEIDLTDFYFAIDAATTNNGIDVTSEMNINGTNLSQNILGIGSNSAWMHFNYWKNNGEWMPRAFLDPTKYKCKLTDHHLQFNVRILNMFTRAQIVDNNFGNHIFNLKIKKLNE